MDDKSLSFPSNPKTMKEADLKYIIDHVFLPPRLPQKHDDDTHRKDGVLLNVVAQAATRFANLLPPIYEAPGPLKVWKIIEKTLNTMGSIYSEGHVDRSKLQAALEGMEVDGQFHDSPLFLINIPVRCTPCIC